MPQKEMKALDALAEALARKVKRATSDKPRLSVVPTPSARAPGAYDEVTRFAITSRIRFLCRSYQLRWLLEQETFNAPCIECLGDLELAALLQKMEHARECIAEGTSFEDAGLVRNTSVMLESWTE